MKIQLLILILIMTKITTNAIASPPELEWLPSGSSYPTPIFDPKATIHGISMLNYDVKGEKEQVAYVPVTLSMQQSFLRMTKPQDRMWEIGMSFSIFSQWSIIDAGQALLGGLQNTDYRISAVGTIQWNKRSHTRFSLFHQSSHLGDDYIIRNSITDPALRTLNYEQFDMSYSKILGNWHTYIGGGLNVSPNTVRRRLTFQLGAEKTRDLTKYKGVALKLGAHITSHQQNDFSPNIRLGLGLELGGNTLHPFIVLISAYDGHLPYSTLEYQKVRLLGLSLVIPLN